MYKSIILVAVCLLVGMPLSAGMIYPVVIDTTPLVGSLVGPYSLQFQLIDGSGAGDGNNVITLGNFQFGGGAALAGTASSTGGVIGDMETLVLLQDVAFFNVFQQQFTPGTSLSFVISTTTNVDAGGVPDMLSATILDKNGTEVPTSSPDGGAVMELTLDSSNPALQTFYLAPEPGSAALVFGAFALAGLWYGRSRKAA